MAGIGDAPFIQKLAVPAVSLLIAFLGYTSQLLFNAADDLRPGPLTRSETVTFNLLLLCLWYTYGKACTVDPGRYVFSSRVLEVPPSPTLRPSSSSSSSSSGADNVTDRAPVRRSHGNPSQKPATTRTPTQPNNRWCRKCSAPKPPRAHHCRTCARCVPKMDHHCPWTTNCVSLTTFPHFIRFLFYANVSLWYLSAALIFPRVAALWRDRFLPAYLGPSLPALAHLSLLAMVDFFTCVALGIMLFTTTKSWLFNTTTIEEWEMEKHEEVVNRARTRGGAGTWWDEDREGHDTEDESESESESDSESEAEEEPQTPTRQTGKKAQLHGTQERRSRGQRRRRDGPTKIDRVEFPYDLGIYANLSQAMGSSNPISWLLPWSGNPAISAAQGEGTGWVWEENGFNDREGMWPPLDPDKSGSRGWRTAAASRGDDYAMPQYGSREEEIAAFRSRQEADLKRRMGDRSQIIAELEEMDGVQGYEVAGKSDDDPENHSRRGTAKGDNLKKRGTGGASAWTNSDGERLGDYGVDEEAEDQDQAGAAAVGVDPTDEDVPLAELIRRRKVLHKDDDE